jgi:iron complex outermembrane receptor protein
MGFRKSGKFRLTANGFYRNVNNAINYTKASIADKWAPSNFANVTYLGADIRLAYPFCKNATFMASYTYLDANLSVSNDYLNKYGLDHARHYVSAQLMAQLAKNLSFTFSGRFVERFIGTNYTVFDARLNWKLTETMNFNIDATNLLNRNYVDRGFIPMPGRWIRVGLQFRI